MLDIELISLNPTFLLKQLDNIATKWRFPLLQTMICDVCWILQPKIKQAVQTTYM